MKSYIKFTVKFIFGITLLTLVQISCSDDFLEISPIGVYDKNSISNKKGVEGLLINAYAALDGNFDQGGFFAVGADNWIYGSLNAGEAYRGSTGIADQAELNFILQWDTPPSSQYIVGKFGSIYDGVGRANEALRVLAEVDDPLLTNADRIRIEAEARFIRGFQHFEGKKIFNNVPFVDETIITDFKIPNTDEAGNYIDIWPRIEEDFEFGYENLNGTMSDIGRVNKWAAGAFLAKALVYQGKYQEAQLILEDIILNGTTSAGIKYDLFTSFGDNFRIETQNGSETVFGIQHTVDASSTNGYYDAILNYPNGIAGGTNSWFFRPSQNLVNSFRTSAEGLPLINSYNDESVTSNENVSDSDPFTPYSGFLDPRLDHTVGRRGIPYLDWGLMTGNSFVAGSEVSITLGGPYTGKKHVFSSQEVDNGEASRVAWGYFTSSMNYPAMRFSDVLLMAAESEIELNGDLGLAATYIDRVRQRAADSEIITLDGSDLAANYNVGLYGSFTGQQEAREALRFERRLEFALEGHRFFDMVRWGTAEEFVNNEFLPKESDRRPAMYPSACCSFDVGRDEYQPIPEFAITQSIIDGEPTLKQNPGY